MRSLPVVCPAATAVSPPLHGPSVVCGVLDLANTDAHIGGFRQRGQAPALMSGTSDRRTVLGFCAGQGVPGSPQSYCSCALWRAEKDRIAEARRAGADGLIDTEAARAPDRSDAERELMARMQAGVDLARDLEPRGA